MAMADGYARATGKPSPEDLKPALEKALHLGKPAVVDVNIHPEQF